MSNNEHQPSVLVTGATGGIGTATVRALVDKGYRVYASVRTESPLLAGLADVRLVRMDVTDPDSVAAAAKAVQHDTGDWGLHAVVNNAGIIVQGPLELVPPAELRRQFEVNTYGPVYVTQAFLPLLRMGSGRVINVSAPTARVPMPFLAALSGSKAALAALSTALRLELSTWDIPVVLVEPGSTRTAIFQKADTAAKAALNAAPPMRVALYQEHLAAIEKSSAAMRLRPVEPVASTIAAAVSARHPRRHYTVGDARAIGLLLRLPTGLRERVVTRALGLAGVRAR